MGFADRSGGSSNIVEGTSLTDGNVEEINSASESYTLNQTLPAPTSSHRINITSEYIRVSAIELPGTVSNLQKALDMADAGGGGSIYILNGTYQAAAELAVPDVPIVVTGQSRNGVVLKNLAGSNLFTLHNNTKSFSFAHFSIESQNVAAFSKMFDFYGDGVGNLLGTVKLDDIAATLVDNASNAGDQMFYVSSSGQTGSVSLQNLVTTGGYVPINADTYTTSPIEVSGCSMTNAIGKSLLFQAASYFKIQKNIFSGSAIGCSLYGLDASAVRSSYVEGNSFTGASPYGVEVIGAGGILIRGNQINITGTNPVGIYAETGVRSQIEGNHITVIPAVDTNTVKGISLFRYYDSGIRGNIIYASAAGAGNDNFGIYLNGINSEGAKSERNIVSANHIDMVNNAARDIGIGMTAYANYNVGGINVTYRCGTSISDLGTSNTVTATDF